MSSSSYMMLTHLKLWDAVATHNFKWVKTQPFQAWIYHCNLHQLQAVNCWRNSRRVVDEDELKCVANENNILLLLNTSIEMLGLKSLGSRKLSHYSEMQNDVLMHREGLKG